MKLREKHFNEPRQQAATIYWCNRRDVGRIADGGARHLRPAQSLIA